MSVKKFLVLSIAGATALGAAAAQAGGPDMMAPPAPVDYSGIYADVDVGWVQSNWSAFWAGGLNPAPMAAGPGAINTNGRSGFTWGADLGYQFNRYFGTELGWYKLPTVSGTQGIIAPVGGVPQGLSIRSWILYLAGKVSVPVFDSLDLFGKAGVVWRNLSYSGGARSNVLLNNLLPTSGHYWAPFLGFGAQWWINTAWSVNIQYLLVPANTRDASVANANDVVNQAPSANLVVAGVGYKFAI